MGRVRVVSKDIIRFRDRFDAGRALSGELGEYKGNNVLVLGVPRGGVVIAYQVALTIKGEMDIVLAHKLGTPGHSELAMGAVSENGEFFINKELVRSMGINENQIDAEKHRQFEELKRRAEIFRVVQPKIPVKDRIVIVTDDGVATGSTTLAAIWAVRSEKPAKLVLAVPVGPEDTVERLSREVDELVCLATPPYFSAVGQFYMQFAPVEDGDVLTIIKKATSLNQG
jgi:putative phosphoribosyl transferase